MTEGQLRLQGLLGNEERWTRSLAVAAQNHQPDTLDQQPAWLRPPGQAAAPRPSPAERAAARASATQQRREEEEAMALPEQLPAGFQDVWRRLLDPTLRRGDVDTCWRLLHCTLGCKAYLTHVRLRGEYVGQQAVRDSAGCSHPACRDSGDLVPETLTHCFVLCPAVAQAVEWLLATWAHLSGQAPPPNGSVVDVLLLDDASAWLGGPALNSRERSLWNRLRVAFLGAVWAQRCQRESNAAASPVSLARAAAQSTLDAVVDALERDWRRCQSSLRQQHPHVNPSWFLGFDETRPQHHFVRQWATPPILCTVHDGQLAVRLGGVGSPPLPD